MDNDEQKSSRSDPVALLDDRVPSELLRKLLQCVAQSYLKAYEEAMAHESGQHSYLFGHLRYVHIEHTLRNINFPGVEVRVRMINSGLYRIAQVVINGVILTASSNIFDNRLPRRAHFRELLAQHTTVENPLPFLDVERQVEKGMEDIELYGIINHGKDRTNLTVPAFVGILFPDKPYQNVLGRIDLLKRFPISIEEFNVEANIKPEVRIKPKRVNE